MENLKCLFPSRPLQTHFGNHPAFAPCSLFVPSPVRAARGMPPIMFGVYFNALVIVVLADPVKEVARVVPQGAPDDLGVFSIRELSDQWGE